MEVDLAAVGEEDVFGFLEFKFTRSSIVSSSHGHGRKSWRSLSARSVPGRTPVRSGRRKLSSAARIRMFLRRKV